VPAAVMDGISVTAPAAPLGVGLCPVREAGPLPAAPPEAEPSWEMPETLMELICDSWAAIAAGIWIADVTS